MVDLNDYATQTDIYLCRAIDKFETLIDRVLTPNEIIIFKCGASYGMRFTAQYIDEIMNMKN